MVATPQPPPGDSLDTPSLSPEDASCSVRFQTSYSPGAAGRHEDARGSSMPSHLEHLSWFVVGRTTVRALSTQAERQDVCLESLSVAVEPHLGS